ncbi:MAG TPA: glycosyltransferase [Solirubrobacteraceae bacterium]
MSLPASIIIPTRARPHYLEVALASIAPQAQALAAEVLVIDDAGPSAQQRAIAERFGARYEPHPRPLGLNVARNTGVEHSSGELVVFVDDDVEVREGWLAALIGAAREHPDVDVFTGPIHPRLEGRPPRSCGRERAPITSLDLGDRDTDQLRYAWGANMALRRSALQAVGPFDVSLRDGGDEQEWQERLRRRGPAKVLYVAAAALEHRRCARDARARALVRAAYRRGRASRRFDRWRGQAPSLKRELATFLGSTGHVLRYRCPAGVTMVAHSAGRLRQGLAWSGGAGTRTDEREDFLSGESGTVGGLHGLGRSALDELASALQLASGQRLALAAAARRSPPRRRVLVLGIERPEHAQLARRLRGELERSRHELEVAFTTPGQAGKFENLNRLLAAHPVEHRDWLLIVDDDIVLPHGFLDRMLFLAERFSLDLAQPAHRLASHAAWRVTRRRLLSVARQTAFVEIGPLTAFSRRTFDVLLPFPPLQMGWGLDLHWAALARERGWRCGVLDALAISHIAAPAASSYSREQAVCEERAFLAEHSYLTAREAQQTLATYRRF